MLSSFQLVAPRRVCNAANTWSETQIKILKQRREVVIYTVNRLHLDVYCSKIVFHTTYFQPCLN